MALILDEKLPAYFRLRSENADVIAKGEFSLLKSENSPLAINSKTINVGLLNLMPDKKETEYNWASVLSNSEMMIKLALLKVESYSCRESLREHVNEFYVSCLEAIDTGKLNCLIITGAPVEMLEFEGVKYWSELKRIYDMSIKRNLPIMNICWSAQASLYHYFGVSKFVLKQKKFGVYKVNRACENDFTSVLPDRFDMPISRHTSVNQSDVDKNDELIPLLKDELGEYCLIGHNPTKQLFMFNHFEYSADTLSKEYFRDLEKGLKIQIPHNYFPDNDIEKSPENTWRDNGRRFFLNWISKIQR
jgi:homoserine O-succinyltransferase/O-acetyltransferase